MLQTQNYNHLLSSISNEPVALINRYLENFIARYGVNVNFHDICGVSLIHPQLEKVLSPYLYHNNSFCNFVKKHEPCFQQCVNQKSKLFQYCSQKAAPFFGQCYMGVQEFVYPIFCGNKLIAFFCIGIFVTDSDQDKNVIYHNAVKMELNPAQCTEIYMSVARKVGFPVLEMSYDLLLLCNSIQNLYKAYIENIPAGNTFQADHTIQRTIEFIRKNYHRNLSLELLAANCYCNPSYLSHIFKQKVKIGITDYIHQIRMEQAKNLLDVSSYSITEISGLTGFQDSGYFTRVFKRMTGLTPTAYRFRKS